MKNIKAVNGRKEADNSMAKDLRKFCEENGYLSRKKKEVDNDNNKLEPIVYTTKQMSQLLCMSEQSVRNLIKENNIPVIPGTKNVLVRKETFDNFINRY